MLLDAGGVDILSLNNMNSLDAIDKFAVSLAKESSELAEMPIMLPHPLHRRDNVLEITVRNFLT